jgi:hypothetical protein
MGLTYLIDHAWPGQYLQLAGRFPSDLRLPESKKYLVLLRLFPVFSLVRLGLVSAQSPPAGQYNASDHGCISVSDDNAS